MGLSGPSIFFAFSEDVLHVSWQARHFGYLDVILRGKRSTFDVSCCLFLRIELPDLHEVVPRANSMAGLAFCDIVMEIDGLLARNVDFEVGP